MSAHMKRIIGGLLGIVFILGVVVSPALHKAHHGLTCGCSIPGTSHGQHSGGCGGETPDGHDSDHCPLCQLALTPLITASALPAPILTFPVGRIIFLPADTPALQSFCDPHFARGPPNA
ncbi:MAG: DUF2946 family protein [Kiritimatiellae bacterium]|nr:DUF2946 family protein [Kiritimatiellia bacterium]